MTTRQLRHSLSLAAAGLTLVAVGVVVWAVLVPPSQHQSPNTQGLAPAGDPAQGNLSIAPPPNRSALLALAETPLRQQLFDPPPQPPERPPPPPPMPGIELISTILPSNGEPSAWVREAANGNTPRKVRVGDVLGPANNTATVTAIEPDRLLVEHSGEVKPIERTAGAPGGRR